MFKQVLILLLSVLINLYGTPQSTYQWSEHRLTLLHRLNPDSLSQHLAFYELYPKTPEGIRALNQAWSILGANQKRHMPFNANFASSHFIQCMVQLVNRNNEVGNLNLPCDQISLIQRLGQILPHRKLKGHTASSENDILKLDSDEIDLSRALLLSQLDQHPQKMELIHQYEAVLDLMALQILGYLRPFGGQKASPEEKINAINRFIFAEMHYRFPPKSSFSPDIDLYTFLPSVLDSRRGVCLGISLLYVSLAQRLELPVEIITPPGHIYVRCITSKGTINVETTARGIHLPDETYLNINTRKLKQRSIKESIGLAHFNQASVFSQQQEYMKAVEAYLKAQKYMLDDPLLLELLAYHLLFIGKTEEGNSILKSIRDQIPEESIIASTIIEDYLEGKIDSEGIKISFSPTDNSHESIIEKQTKLKEILKNHPHFKDGLLQLSVTWIQLDRDREALETLEIYHNLYPSDPTVEYYLAQLHAERYNFVQAWQHLKSAEQLTAERDHHPSALRSLQHSLRQIFPE